MEKLEGIKNIIFDLGGVIINIDYTLTIKAFESLGIKNASLFFSQHSQIKLFDDLETGKIGSKAFFDGIRELCGKHLPDNDIKFAWNAMLLDFPEDMDNVLKKVKKHYKTFLLSNTNAIHYEDYMQRMFTQFNTNNMSLWFDEVYLSHIIGMRKPNKEVFELILKENNLKANETLFIDDSFQHIEGASKLGIHTHWLKDNNLHRFLLKSGLL